MSDRKYEILLRESLFQGYFRVDRFHLRQELFTGGWSAPFSREIFNGAERAAVVILFDPQHDKVVMVEQFRAGPLTKNESPFTLEFVAGMVGASEDPADAVRREAIEEANCEVQALQRIFSFYPSPGCVAEQTTLFVARTNAPEDGLICGVEKESEHIRVRVLGAMEAISLLYSGKLRDAASLLGMQWFALNHTELRSRWLVSEASTPII